MEKLCGRTDIERGGNELIDSQFQGCMLPCCIALVGSGNLLIG